MFLDTRTICFALASGSLIMALGLFIVNVRSARLRAMTLWVVANVALFAAWTLYGLRGIVPDWVSVTVAFAALNAGYALEFAALADFSGFRVRVPAVAGLALAGMLLHAALYVTRPGDEEARIVLASVVFAAWLLACGALLLVNVKPEERASHTLTAAFFLACALVDGLRAAFVPLHNVQAGAFLSDSFSQTVSGAIDYLAMFGTSLGFILMTKERADNQLLRIASVDTLTGLLNRRTFTDAAVREVARAKRQQLRTSVLMLDLDRFKRVNDTYGHPAGDLVLANFGRVLRGSVRPFDIAGRYGGEEFCVLLPGTALDEAYTIAERIRTLVEQSPVEVRGTWIVTTVSIGVVEGSDERSLADLIEHADQAMYAAKAAGRNGVRVYAAAKA